MVVVAVPVEPESIERLPYVLTAFAGAGYVGYEGRGVETDAHLHSEVLAALSAGYLAVRRPGTSLAVSAEALVARSLESSLGARAAGNLLAGGVVLTAFLRSLEIGVGGYLVSRASAARQLGLTESRLHAGIGASLGKTWAVTDHFIWGLGVKVLMLPTTNYVDAYGRKHVRLSDGLATLGVSIGWR